MTDLKSSPASQRLLDTACELFCREGIHATGVARLLAKSNVSRRTLYEFYGSKDNLLRAVFKREAEMWFSWFNTDLPAHHSSPTKQLIYLFQLLQAWFGSGRFYGCLFTNAVAESDKSSSWIKEIAQNHFNKVQSHVEAIAQAAGFDDPEEKAQQICLLIDGAITTAMVSESDKGALIAQAILNKIILAELRSRGT